MALENIPTIGPGALNANLDKVVVYKNGGSEAAVSLLTLVNSAIRPSGVSGSIQFSDGTAFSSDSANLFWDNVNKRIGINTNAPTSTANIKGSGSTSATTSLLVQNSSGTTALNVNDAGQVCVGGTSTYGYPFLVNGGVYFTSSARIDGNATFNTSLTVAGSGGTILTGGRTVVRDGNGLLVGGSPGLDIPDASAAIEIRTTTKGFLNARVTTAEKNAIATPAAGLQVYDSTLNRPCFYNGTSWITL